MPHNRYYLDADLNPRSTVQMEGDECHHLVKVSRAKPGDQVELVNGRGILAQAKIQHISKGEVEFSIEHVLQADAPKTPLIIAMGIPRMNHLEWVIEKGTELNATSFWLFPGLLSEKDSLSPSQFERLKHLSISAMKQCGRLDLPSIEVKTPLLKWTSLTGTVLFGDVNPDAPSLWSLSREKPLASPIIFFIGPERGFDPREEAFLQEKLGAQGVRLHPNILRTETAPLVALSLIQTLI